MRRSEREELWAKLAAMIREIQTKQAYVQSAESNLTNNQQVHSPHEEKAEMPTENNFTRTPPPQLTLSPHFEDRVLYHLVALTGPYPLPLGSGVSEADLAKCLADELGISPDFPHNSQFHISEARSIVLAAVTMLEQKELLEAIKVFGTWTIRPTLAGRRSVEQWNEKWRKSQLKTQNIFTGDSPDFKILTPPVFQTNAQNWIDVNANGQRIEIKNIGKENAYHIYAALFGCETYIVPNTMPQKRIDLEGFHWRDYSGCPLEPGDTLTLTLVRHRDRLDGKQELGDYQLYAPQEPSLYDVMHNPSLPFHSARLTLTYHDRFGHKYAQTFDYDHHKKSWVYLAYPRAITVDFFDLLRSKDKESISSINRNQANGHRNILYQLFFAELLERLREARPGITNAKKTQPENFCFFGAGKTGYMFNWAFTKNGIKTELIINVPGNRAATKEAFDTLYEQRATIEKEFGQSLIWDRLEGKESHIFLLRLATIDAPIEELEHTKKWAVETMIKFADVFKKRIKSL
ncbi:hypothetical protein KDK_46820 [Dictyobacter kobayashii]|uniref:DUF4268 domain-containing protein n=2 Tax=Dictyobacter kobayashii TaxID=2014872 RepID=A0A402AP63_9CHLR|nr:hypothetical protein KDK_46820 [Dictyobacter kobayashii]